MALTFDRNLEVSYGECVQVSPLIRRVVANNPSVFTFLGTGTYIIGRGDVAVIDPGPDDEKHIEAILRATTGETITHILITHTHADHSPGAAALVRHTGAPTFGFGPHPIEDRADVVDADAGTVAQRSGSEPSDGRSESNETKGMESDETKGIDSNGPEKASDEAPRESFDAAFIPTHVTTDGHVVRGSGWTIDAVHTPGHLSNHLCFGLREELALFSGDHVMGWSTSVISPPGGDLRAYLSSCAALLGRRDIRYWPTHGPAIENPGEYVTALIAHRNNRTRQIVDRLRTGPATIDAIVADLYSGLDTKLVKAAGRSVLAHLEALAADGTATGMGDPTAGRSDQTTWRLI